MSQVQKDVGRCWRELSEEEKRPYVDRYKAKLKIWQEKRDILISYLQAMEEEDKSGGKDNRSFNGRILFQSEVQIPGASLDFLAKASKMWNKLTPKEKEVYNERARKINEDGQGNLLKSTLKQVGYKGKPIAPYLEFLRKIMPQKLKVAHNEIMREWSELSDEEKEKYVKASEEEFKAYNAQMEEYKGGEKFTEDKRNKKVLMGKIKDIEEELEKPKLLTSNGYLLFMKENAEHYKGSLSKAASMWHALDEEGKTEYNTKFYKFKADWQQEVDKWEARNADNPKMTELRAYKSMLHPYKK